MQRSAEGALLQRVAKHDTDAVVELYDLLSSQVYGLSICILGDQAAAEDLLQEVFLKVCEQVGTYNPEVSTLKVWLARITQKLASERLRSKRSGVETRQDNVGSLEQSEVERGSESADVLMALPQEQRVLIEYAFFKGFTQSELAECFKRSIDEVHVGIWRGMSTLMKSASEPDVPAIDMVRSHHLDMLAAVDALGALDGEDLGEFQRLMPNVTLEAQKDVASYQQVAFRIASGRAERRMPPQAVRDWLTRSVPALLVPEGNDKGEGAGSPNPCL